MMHKKGLFPAFLGATSLILGLVVYPEDAEARGSRGSTRTSVSRGGGGGGGRTASAQRNTGAARNASANRGTNAGANRNYNDNRNYNSNRNYNQNVNVNRNYNDIDVNVDHDYHGYYGGGYGYPVAAAATVVAATAVTAAAIGSMVHTLPPSCTTVVQNNVTYQNCNGTWYQPQYSGTSVTYVVVNAP